MSASPTPAALPELRIAIVGAGMGGLAAAASLASHGFKNVSVYEAAPQFGEVGAGLNCGPNINRILERWGVWDIVKSEGVVLDGTRVVDSGSDNVLSDVDLTTINERYGYPYMVAHRAALHRALLAAAERYGVRVAANLDTFVVDVDFAKGRLLTRKASADPATAPSKWQDADVVIAADGVKSTLRAKMLAKSGQDDQVEETGQAAYRIVVPREQMASKPELLELVDAKRSHRWVGEKRMIIAYPISEHRLYNIVSAHPDSNFASQPSTTWTATGSKSAMLDVFHDFCPRVKQLLDLAPDGQIMEWALRTHKPLARWTHDRVLLIGDAAHPMLPHLAQGAAQAVEDGAVIGAVLARVRDSSDVPAALRVFQKLRQARTDMIVVEAAASGKAIHLGAGAAQAERDRLFAEAAKTGANPDRYVDKEMQDVLYAFDCVSDAETRYDELFATELRGKL